jgi:hypothetical protein
MRKWSIFSLILTRIFELFPNNRLVETCCDRTKMFVVDRFVAGLITSLLQTWHYYYYYYYYYLVLFGNGNPSDLITSDFQGAVYSNTIKIYKNTLSTCDRSVGQAVTTCWFHQTCCKLLYQICYLLLVTCFYQVVSTKRYGSVVDSSRQTWSRKPVIARRNQQTCRDLLTTCRKPVKSTACDRAV